MNELENFGHAKVLHRHTKSLNMDTGEVVESETKVLLKKEKRERFMMLYVKNFNLVVELSKRAQNVLAKLIANRVTYGTNEVVLSSGVRAQLAEELGTTKQVVANCISELVTKEILGRKKLKGGGWIFHLNPFLFGDGEWNMIQKQRQQYTIDYDFQNYTAKKEITATTSYEDLPDKEDIRVLKREQYTDKYGVGHFTALITTKDDDSVKDSSDEIVTEPIEDLQNKECKDTPAEPNSLELNVLKEQNRAKELSIKELELQNRAKELSIKELELKAKLDNSTPSLFDS